MKDVVIKLLASHLQIKGAELQLPPSVAIQNAQIKKGKARAPGTATIKKQRPISSVFSLLSAIWVHMVSRWGGDDSEGSAAERRK